MAKTDKKNKGAKNKGTFFKIAGIAAGIVLLLIVFSPLIISFSPVSSLAVGFAESKTGFDIELSQLRVGWTKGIMMYDVHLKDPEGRIDFKADKFFIHPSLTALLRKEVDVKKCLLEGSRTTLKIDKAALKEAGKKAKTAYSDISYANDYAEASLSPDFFTALNSVKRFRINLKDCAVSLVDAEQADLFELNSLQGRIKLNPPGETSGADLVGRLKQGESSAPLKFFALLNRKPSLLSLKGISAKIDASVQRLQLEGLKPLMDLAGQDFNFQGVADAEISLSAEEGMFNESEVKVKSEGLAAAFPERAFKELKFGDTSLKLLFKTDEGFVDIMDCTCQSGFFDFNLTGQIPKTFTSLVEMMNGKSEAELEGFFNLDMPKAFGRLPEESKNENFDLQSGKIAGRISTETLGEGKILLANMNMVDFEGIANGKNLTLSPVKLNCEIISRNQRLWIDPIEIVSGFGKVRCSGPYSDMSFNGTINLKDLQNELSGFVKFGEYKLSGEANIVGDVLPENKILSGAVQIKDFVLNNSYGMKWIDPFIDLTFGFKNDPIEKKLWLTSLYLKSDYLGEYELLQGYFDYDPKSSEEFVMLFNYKNLFERAEYLITLFDALDKPANLAGRYSTTTKIVKYEDGIRFITDDMSFQDVAFGGEDNKTEVTDFSISSNLFWQPDAAKFTSNDFEIKNEWLTLDFSDLIVDYSDQSDIIFDSTLETVYDLDFMQLYLTEKTGQDFKASGKRTLPASLSTNFPMKNPKEAINNLNAEFQLGFDSLYYKGLSFEKSNVKFLVENGFFTVPKTAIGVNNGSLNFAIEADLAETPIVLKLSEGMKVLDEVEINEVLAGQLAAYGNPVFSDSMDCSGSVNLYCDKLEVPLTKNPAETAELQATAESSQIRAMPAGMLRQLMHIMGESANSMVSYRLRPVDLQLKDGVFTYNNMILEVDDKEFKFNGNIKTDGTMDMEIAIPYRFEGLNLVETQSGQFGITLPLTGSASNPEIDTEDLLQKNTESIIKTGLQEGLKKLLD
ncbi:putative protein involved in outer membrane biogenesis [Sedimentisphaera cyanobacteriorum]|uniref:AsmA-like C-terminal domain-containing protein n=1 Tax=Sedimentisphaera cyanobacteriorum TaxID=1940790 RepID=A0A1Q2HLM1_9BACT|nr:hypothetical protein [Sedimentisphaera cyanobacteriorum]AQQ08367.1 putative protein involved in outer membrane biogenesis [Sedimentisphaera cyanobacteriorum]